jgi:hypothetical protein
LTLCPNATFGNIAVHRLSRIFEEWKFEEWKFPLKNCFAEGQKHVNVAWINSLQFSFLQIINLVLLQIIKAFVFYVTTRYNYAQ